MNYKEALYFIGKCLTINYEAHNRKIVEHQIIKNDVNWELVVKISTEHYVFPALYCNLNRANLLSLLPKDLVDFMKEITDLNRERNLQIIEQAKEINSILLANTTRPIFLKGTGNLLEGLYEDIAERMVGDIDFIIAESELENAVNILKKHGYRERVKSEFKPLIFRHYPRLVHKKQIAAVEIHKEVVIKKYTNDFSYKTLRKQLIKTKQGQVVLSYKNQLLLSAFAYQINDRGQQLNMIALRNAYDVFLLSKKTNNTQYIDKNSKIYRPLYGFMLLCKEVFNHPSSIQIPNDFSAKKSLNKFQQLLANPEQIQKRKQKIDRIYIFKTRIFILLEAVYKKETRNWLFAKFADKDWQKSKLSQLGFKPKS
ncbi:nucleotidyltransferase family protein [Polaribacter pacificus]|nr:nucleotidyltransferase family protein [Polaribacter pacificus]